MEKARGRYFTLKCGHVTTMDEQEVWSAFKPGRGKYWCDSCNEWVRVKPKPKRNSLPQEPLF